MIVTSPDSLVEQSAGDDFLRHTCGFRSRIIEKIVDHFGTAEEARRRIVEDPYCLVDVPGIGFVTADRRAREWLGVAEDDPRRLTAFAVWGFRHLDDGHCFLPLVEALEAVTRVGRSSRNVPQLSREQALTALRTAIRAGHLSLEQVGDVPIIWHRNMREAEVMIADFVGYGVRSECGEAPGRAGDSDLTSEQWAAVELAMTRRCSVITGGPGVGKTHTVEAIVDEATERGEEVALLALMGVTRRRLEEVADHPAFTIHRYRAVHRLDEPDLIIVDEMSVVDLLLFRSVVEIALETGARLVLVGDSDQLPSIEAGFVLGDVVASVPVTHLTHNFRSGAVPALVAGARAVLAGQTPTPGAGLTMIDCSSERLTDEVLAVVRSELAAGREAPRVCTWRNSDRRELNLAIQAEANPPRAGRAEWESPTWSDGTPRWAGGEVLREGDRVMHLENDYKREVNNGDLGEVSQILDEDVVVSYPRAGQPHLVTYDFSDHEDRDTLTLGYAFTVHKSQGGEAPVMVIALPFSNHRMGRPSRNLLYTAMTRAQERAVLVGPRSVFAAVAGNVEPARNTRLAARIRGAYD